MNTTTSAAASKLAARGPKQADLLANVNNAIPAQGPGHGRFRRDRGR
jgi:hypothetical protein